MELSSIRHHQLLLAHFKLGHTIRAAERWRAVKVTEFERRQLAAGRQDLDHEYEARTGLKSKRSSEDSQTKIPTTSRA